MIDFTLSFEGSDADNNRIDFYDVAHALIGFQRSLALTTHLVINGTIITQAPSLKNAEIIAFPPEEGSWKIVAGVAATAYALSTAPMDTPLGHLMHSAYDYVVSETLGFHVDYEQSLGQQYEQLRSQQQNNVPVLEQHQFDSVIEKCEYAIQEMHRPIVMSQTAQRARIFYNYRGHDVPFEAPLTSSSYEYIRHTEISNRPIRVSGKISSYNLNTFKGRIFIPDEGRPIPFTLNEAARSGVAVLKIMENMSENARDRFMRDGSLEIEMQVFRNTSRSGRLKSYNVIEVI